MNGQIKEHIELSLLEDAAADDITSKAIFPMPSPLGKACFVAKQNLILSGINIARAVFLAVNPKIKFTGLNKDGSSIKTGETFAKISGPVASLLAAERTALNYLQNLSGVATITAEFVAKAKKCVVLDTRKTIPGLRDLQKQAVIHGGGTNHRRDLSAMFLIKENHIEACGGITQAIQRCRGFNRKNKKRKKIEIEVKNLAEFREALTQKVDFILLDNMSVSQIKLCVKENTLKIPLEVSGNVSLKNIATYAKLGVDRISIGSLTHSVKAADISMLLES